MKASIGFLAVLVMAFSSLACAGRLSDPATIERSAAPVHGDAALPPGAPRAAPAPQELRIWWAGAQGDSVIAMGPRDHPTATVTVAMSSATRSYAFDLLILRSLPAPPIAFAKLASSTDSVWSMSSDDPTALHSMPPDAGGSRSLTLDWDHTDHLGRSVAPGRYYLVVLVTRDGVQDQYSIATASIG